MGGPEHQMVAAHLTQGAVDKITVDKITAKRMTLAGHCIHHPKLPAGKVVLWEPTHGQRVRGRPRGTFVDTLRRGAAWGVLLK